MRKAADLNQRELAERLGKTQSYVAKVELHERRLDIIQLVEWLRALDADEKVFLLDTLKEIPKTRRRH
jgi:transcriptional regulator with XRE-family HTH domain